MTFVRATLHCLDCGQWDVSFDRLTEAPVCQSCGGVA